MLKDTKSLGNNKAPACESRGFVRKRKKGCILTHLHISKKKLVEIEALKQIIGDPFIKMHIDQLIRSHEKNNN